MNFDINKRKQRKKKKRRFLTLLLILGILGILGYKKIGNILNIDENIVTESIDKITHAENSSKKLPEEVLNSSDENIQLLISDSKKDPKAKEILQNLDVYPESLILLAAKRPESRDFVLDYPSHKNSSSNTSVFSQSPNHSNRKFPLFIQWDKKWGYDKYGSDFLAVNGCGPTSLAMVVAGLKDDEEINPKSVADFSDENGYLVKGVGTSWSLMSKGARHYGLRAKKIPLTKYSILNSLKKGNPIIVTVGPGTFTDEGHFLVLTGVDENDKITINDPASEKNSNKAWDVDVFLKETRNLWSFTLAY